MAQKNKQIKFILVFVTTIKMYNSSAFSYKNKNTIKSKNKLKHRDHIKCLMLNQWCNAYMNLGYTVWNLCN